MKLVILLSIFAVALSVEQYDPEHDDIDVEAIVNSNDTLKSFHGCFMDATPCNDVEASFKKDLAEAIQEACAKCTAAQKHILRRYNEALKQKLPKEYAEFTNKYDPENKYFAKLEAAIATA